MLRPPISLPERSGLAVQNDGGTWTMQRCLGVDGAGHNEQGVTCRVLVDGSRCPACALVTARAKQARRPRNRAERARRAATVRDWLAERGPVCPGWEKPPHYVDAADLTADHPHAVAAGGQETQPLTVLCRSCNSSKGSRS